MVVYTDYGYADVDLAKFRAQLQELAERSKEMQETIKDYFMVQYAALVEKNVQKQVEEAAAAKAAKEENQAAAESTADPPKLSRVVTEGPGAAAAKDAEAAQESAQSDSA